MFIADCHQFHEQTVFKDESRMGGGTGGFERFATRARSGEVRLAERRLQRDETMALPRMTYSTRSA